MTREVWNNIPAGRLGVFTGGSRYWQAADAVSIFPGAVAPANAGNAFAARIRAHLTAPVTGNYTFWIASDDDSELRLATGESKFDRVKIASVSGWVNPQAWDAMPSQKSVEIPLEAGQRYFIEALHMDAGGDDHLAFAWRIPGGVRELIPASALESFTADPNDLDNDELRDDWESAHGFSISENGTANPDQHPLADPDHDGYSNLEESQYGTDPTLRGGVPGSLLLETWNYIGGPRVNDLTYHARSCGTPDISEFVFSAETPANRTDNFGARMRGFVIAPITGDYTFYLSGDDDCQLWLSPSESQFARQKAAAVDGWTDVRQWTRHASQKSAVIALQAGQKIYIEALQKESNGGDHLEIGWTTPGSTGISVIPGSALESYAYDANDADGDNMPDDWEALHDLDPAVNDAVFDPDQDGILNQLEASSKTDPQAKNTIAGALLQELWLNVPGYHVAALTSSPRFLQQPDFRSLVTSTRTDSQPYDSFGSRLRGYLTAPATGSYTFWVLGDDETELWLSSFDSKFDKQLLVRPTLNTSNFDTDLSQKSRPVNLIAGQTYYIEILHKDYYGGDFCQIAWTKPGSSREIIPGSALGSFIPVANDQDDDDLPDDWEIANGLDPHDNGRLNPANGSQGDLDGDGLSNAEELRHGTRADLADTDGDGVNDRDEIKMLETSALTADAAPFESIATIPGSSFSATSGEWTAANGKAMQACVRGWLEYPVTLSAAGIYQLDLTFTPVTGASVSPEYEIVFSADGKTIQRETVTVAEATSGHAKILTPWLSAGSHTLRLFIDNSYWFRRISIDQLEVLAACGPDANGNGTPDWIEHRLAKHNSLAAPSESITSPACLEGKSRWFEMTTINGTPVQAAPNDRWFTDIPLNTTQPTTITAALENGGVTVVREVNWTPVNLLECGDLTIRVGDSLQLTAFKSQGTTSNEHSILTLEGQSHTVAADSPLIHGFDTPGSFPVRIFKSENGNGAVTTVTIHVIAAPVIESPVCVVGFHRPVDFPALPSGVTLQLDERIEIRETTTDASGAKHHTLRLNTLDDRSAILRMGGATGPILGMLPFRPMRVRDASETALFISGILGANQWDVSMPVVVDGNHPDTSIDYDIFIGGVVFDDATLKRTLLPSANSDFQWSTILHFYKTGLLGSNCFRVSVWQGHRRIAFYQ